MKNKVDLAALKTASSGDPKTKVMVSKAWLRVIHAELQELHRRRKDEELALRSAGNLDKDIDEGFRHVDEAFGEMDKAFGRIFRGKGFKGMFGGKS